MPDSGSADLSPDSHQEELSKLREQVRPIGWIVGTQADWSWFTARKRNVLVVAPTLRKLSLRITAVELLARRHGC